MIFDYAEAMERKLSIAQYHLAQVCELLPDAVPDQGGLPPIPLQAHFEACARAIVAMPDQLASAVASMIPGLLKVHKANPQVLLERLEPLSNDAALQLRDIFVTLNSDSRLNDLRDVRNRSTHRFDEKEYKGGHWRVLPATFLSSDVAPYEGSRELGDYLGAMIEFERELLGVVETTEKLAETLAASEAE